MICCGVKSVADVWRTQSEFAEQPWCIYISAVSGSTQEHTLLLVLLLLRMYDCDSVVLNGMALQLCYYILVLSLWNSGGRFWYVTCPWVTSQRLCLPRRGNWEIAVRFFCSLLKPFCFHCTSYNSSSDTGSDPFALALPFVHFAKSVSAVLIILVQRAYFSLVHVG